MYIHIILNFERGCLVSILFIFETVTQIPRFPLTCYVAKDDCVLILLPPLPEYWAYRYALLHMVSEILGIDQLNPLSVVSVFNRLRE